LIEGGVAAFKCFMGNTFGNLPAPSDGAMLEGFEIPPRYCADPIVPSHASSRRHGSSGGKSMVA
jgi:hypothetical protein